MSIERWKGKVALVTGASAGIGRAVAERLAAAEMRVAVCARRGDRLRELPDVLAVPTDLRDEGEILRLFETIRNEWGGVDVLVNNAGLGNKAPLMSGATDAWREMVEVNILALCICTREAVSDMRRRGDSGHVIHLSSMAAHRVPSGSGVYSATKFAVRSLTEGLRQELREVGSMIRVSSISPGFVETEFAAHYSQSETIAEEIYSRFPCLQPADMAEAVAYVLGAPEHVQVHDILVRPTMQPT